MAEGTVRVKDFRSQFILQKKLSKRNVQLVMALVRTLKSSSRVSEGEGGGAYWGEETFKRKLRMGVKE